MLSMNDTFSIEICPFWIITKKVVTYFDVFSTTMLHRVFAKVNRAFVVAHDGNVIESYVVVNESLFHLWCFLTCLYGAYVFSFGSGYSKSGTDTSSLVNHNAYMASSSAHQIAYAQMDKQSSEYSPPEAGLVVPIFQKGDDPIDAINHMMSFLTFVVASRYPVTNNQLRTSSNPRQQATINNGRVTIQPIQGWQNFVSAEGGTRLNKYSELSVAEAIQADCDIKATNIILQGFAPE
nr:hypothetical protein [Tanacetum cinerariifolium]